MDYMADHPYADCPDSSLCSSGLYSVERLQSFKTHMAAWPSPYNNLGIWITEIGYWDAADTPGFSSGQVGRASNATQQGQYLVAEMNDMKANGITAPIFWYDLHEDGKTTDVGYGVTRWNGSAYTLVQPTYSNFQSMTDPASDLVISVTPFFPIQTVTAGTAASYAVTVSDVSGFSGGNVTLYVSSLPSGATASWSPSSTISPGSSATLTVQTAGVAAGTYALTITATDANTQPGDALNAQVGLVVN